MTVPGKSRATVRDLRRVNRGAVLRRLFLQGSLNRVALAQQTGLSSGSVTNVTAALLEEGLIAEVGLEESDGGRPRVLLEVNPDFGTVIGVEVGETRIRVEAFDMGMAVVGSVDVVLHPQHHDPQTVVDELVVAIEKLQAQLGRQRRWLVPRSSKGRRRRRRGASRTDKCCHERWCRWAAKGPAGRSGRCRYPRRTTSATKPTGTPSFARPAHIYGGARLRLAPGPYLGHRFP